MDRKKQVYNKEQDVQEEKEEEVGNKEKKKLKGESSSNTRRNMSMRCILFPKHRPSGPMLSIS